MTKAAWRKQRPLNPKRKTSQRPSKVPAMLQSELEGVKEDNSKSHRHRGEAFVKILLFLSSCDSKKTPVGRGHGEKQFAGGRDSSREG